LSSSRACTVPKIEASLPIALHGIHHQSIDSRKKKYVIKVQLIQAPVAHTCVILPTQEAEIRRIEVQSQAWRIVLRDPTSKKKKSQKRAGGVA
jgi:hypothetical protein